MTYRNLRKFREAGGSDLYVSSLTYAHYLWHHTTTARAILALMRAVYCELKPHDPVLDEHPIPYRALRWLMENHPGDSFLGNPRVSFQHQAERMPQLPQRELRVNRAWAAWHLARLACPNLPDDNPHSPHIRDQGTVVAGLQQVGLPQEADWFLAACA